MEDGHTYEQVSLYTADVAAAEAAITLVPGGRFRWQT